MTQRQDLRQSAGIPGMRRDFRHSPGVERPAAGWVSFSLFSELWRRKVRGDVGPYLAFYGHIAWHDDAAERQAQNGALRLERLDDLRPVYLEGT
jgi:hypothetical protein